MQSLLYDLRRPQGVLRAFIIVVMIILMLYMQCVLPCMEAYAIAGVDDLLVGGGIALVLAIMTIAGVKISSGSKIDIAREIYSDLSNTISWLSATVSSIGTNVVKPVVNLSKAKLTELVNSVKSWFANNKNITTSEPLDMSSPTQKIDFEYYNDSNAIHSGTIGLGTFSHSSGLSDYYEGQSGSTYQIKYNANQYNFFVKSSLFNGITVSKSGTYRISFNVHKDTISYFSYGAQLRFSLKYSNGTSADFVLSPCKSDGKYTGVDSEDISISAGTVISGLYVFRQRGSQDEWGKVHELTFSTHMVAIDGLYLPDGKGSICADVPSAVLPKINADVDLTLPLNPADTYDGTRDTIGDILPTDIATDIPNPDVGTDSDLPKIDDLKLPDIISTKFPFSIPWDVKRSFSVMVATPEVPHWEVPFVIPSANINEKIIIDFEQFEPLAVITRWFSVAITVVGLIMATRKLIGQ